MTRGRELAELAAGYDSGGGFGFRNRIINPAMVIDQRNAGASVTPADNAFTIDRWRFSLSQASKLTTQQSTVAPTGFGNSALITSSSAYSVGASEGFLFSQRVEGFNFYDMAWGTASASPVTLSFWVRSSLTGTFGGSLSNAANNRWYAFSYTISAANTWEYKTVTIAGDTTGTWVGATNGIGLNLYFSVGSGSSVSGTVGSWGSSTLYSATGAVSVVGTNGATFYITGVQLEKGSTATSFDYRPYGTELQLCQRYAWSLRGNGQFICNAFMRSTTVAIGRVQFPVTMRATAALTVPNSAGYFNVSHGNQDNAGATIDISGGGTQITQNNASIGMTFSSGSSTVGWGGVIVTNNASSYVLFTAEL